MQRARPVLASPLIAAHRRVRVTGAARECSACRERDRVRAFVVEGEEPLHWSRPLVRCHLAELPQGLTAARAGELWQVHEGSLHACGQGLLDRLPPGRLPSSVASPPRPPPCLGCAPSSIAPLHRPTPSAALAAGRRPAANRARFAVAAVVAEGSLRRDFGHEFHDFLPILQGLLPGS